MEVILDTNTRVQVCSTNVNVVRGRLGSYRHNDGRGSPTNDPQNGEEVKCSAKLFMNISPSDFERKKTSKCLPELCECI
jgi:hypothetical protein